MPGCAKVPISADFHGHLAGGCNFQQRSSWVTRSGDFYSNLGIDHPFLFGKLVLGVDVVNAFRISAVGAIFGPKEIRGENAPWQLGVQVIPSN